MLTQSQQVLRNILLMIESNDFDYTSGMCRIVYDHVEKDEHDFWMTPIVLKDLRWLFSQWPEYSGFHVYPIPAFTDGKPVIVSSGYDLADVKNAAEKAYESCYDSDSRWDPTTLYGACRRRAVTWMRKQLDAMEHTETTEHCVVPVYTD